MTTFKAELLSSQKLPSNERFSEFQYTHSPYDGHYKTDEFIYISTEDRDLRLVFKIGQCLSLFDIKPGLHWEKIKLKESNKRMWGTFVVTSSCNSCCPARGNFNSETGRSEQEIITKCVKDSYFTIKFTVHHRDKPSDKSIAPMPGRGRVIVGGYDNFFNSKIFSDLTFAVGNEEIPAHKLIMSAHSEVFSRMFVTDLIEKKSSRIEITDIDSDIFKLLLTRVYCGKLDCNDPEKLLKLIVAADKYEIRGLVVECEDFISKNLSVDNVVDVLKVADLVKSDVLKKKSIYFIIDNKDEVMDTDSYKDLAKSGRSDLFADIFSKMKCVKKIGD